MKPDLRKSVVYQIYLRNFTPEGTLKGAQRMLPHLKELGIDVIYLSACNREDTAEKGQSIRQIASGMNNNKNPYRIMDYFDIDEEYGTMQDLKDFVASAHALGLYVLIDLVYLHCGSNAVFLSEHPEFVIRDENGDILLGAEWPFARLDYSKDSLREYFYSNMEFYIKDIKADGFRCDVGDHIPLDFWAEGVRRVRKINPEIIMINEGSKPEHLTVFDVNYSFTTLHSITSLFVNTKDGVTDGGTELAKFKSLFDKAYALTPKGKYILINTDNHDTASDLAEKRPEVYLGADAAEAILAFIFTAKGVPMIYNGSEVADALPKNMFWNRFCPGNQSVQWQNACLEVGRHRLALMKALINLHHTHPSILDGDFSWFEGEYDDKVLGFTRMSEGKELLILINFSDQEQSATLAANTCTPLLCQNAKLDGERLHLDAYGFVIVER